MNDSKEQLITTTILLHMNDIHKKNIDGIIRYKLKNEYENACNKHGYVLKDSVVIKNRSVGKLVIHNNESMIEYQITMKTSIINPCINDIFTCKIDSITKMGAIGYLSSGDHTIETSPIIFIIPNEYIASGNNLSKDSTIKVEVLQSRIKYKSKQIQVVGRIID
jgi:DNA-directed RNA polymerase subunit E'/Rpb7